VPRAPQLGLLQERSPKGPTLVRATVLQSSEVRHTRDKATGRPSTTARTRPFSGVFASWTGYQVQAVMAGTRAGRRCPHCSARWVAEVSYMGLIYGPSVLAAPTQRKGVTETVHRARIA
jgi:hypothetical protein